MTELKNTTVYTREYLSTRLIRFRDDYKNEIPNQIIHSDDPDNKYKIRTSWLTWIANDLDRSRTVGILPDSVKGDVDTFFEWYQGEFSTRPGAKPNTNEDIERGNEIINKVLDSLGIGKQLQ